MEKTTIGRTVTIDLPSYGIYGLPAKVDTGADASAIWASAIKEQDGELQFRLLDPSSNKYTGQVITTKEYSKAIYHNSFGQQEKRYRVHLSVNIAGRNIKVRFSLANRQLKSYPALVGRRSLNNKFIVDVSKA